ncbi:MAG TPA: hypothetical protein VMN38_11770 [Sphingomicrobium sp.]|nr:hypothetical protein [Sphingomicrobium sp.]
MHWDKVESALHGDLRPLTELLRSDEPLSEVVREYLADEIEREPGKRFRARYKADLGVRARDARLLWNIHRAKCHLAGTEMTSWFDALDRPHEISDRTALDYLTQTGLYDGIAEENVENARRRCRAAKTMHHPYP